MAKTFSKRDAKRDTQCRLCHREFGGYSMPDEAFMLYVDIERLDLIIDLVSQLDTRSINDGNDSGITVRRLHFILSSMRSQVRQRLARDFLAGKPMPRREKTQTMTDVWMMISDALQDLNRKENDANRNKPLNAAEQHVVK
jgi:hypothetical protein